MDSLCQFYMVAHKKGAAAMGGDKRKRGGGWRRDRGTQQLSEKRYGF